MKPSIIFVAEFTIILLLTSVSANGQVGALSFLGLESSGESLSDTVDSHSESSTPQTIEATGPWGRLPAYHRNLIAPVLIEQLNVPSNDEGVDNIAHQTFDKEYPKWKKLGQSPDQWPQFLFNEVFDGSTRRLFLSIYTKMVDEKLWSQIRTIKSCNPKSPWPGFYVMPQNGGGAFKEYLEGLGYGDWFSASRSPRWGLRSPKTGYQFHIIQCPLDWDQRFIETHIDSYNPGTSDSGLKYVAPGAHLATYLVKGGKHVVDDKWWPDEEDVPGRLKAALREEGLIVPDVDQTNYDNGVTMSDFTKWNTGDKNFGYLWLNARNQTAGWWTTYEGARNFSKVTSMGCARDDGRVSYKLEYYNGFLLFRMKGKKCSATWYKENERRFIEVNGTMVSGHVYRNGRDMD